MMIFTLKLVSRMLGVRASLLIDPAGADNSVLYTAKAAGAAGEAVSVEYILPYEQATTGVVVIGNEIIVIPGSKARMVISGVTTPNVNGTLLYAGDHNGYPHWSSNGVSYAVNVSNSVIATYAIYDDIWIVYRGTSTIDEYISESYTPSYYADGLTYGAPIVGTGTPTVTAGVSSAAQVIAAVNAYPSAAALVTASESGPSGGPVAAVAADYLLLPGCLTLGGEYITLGGIILRLK